MRPHAAQEAQGPQHQEGPLINLERELDFALYAVCHERKFRESTKPSCAWSYAAERVAMTSGRFYDQPGARCSRLDNTQRYIDVLIVVRVHLEPLATV
jgi:hypothetical protein